MDVRTPIGILFTLLGAMLLLYGLFAHPSPPIAGINLNAAWGAVLLVFGVGMLWLAKRFAARSSPKS